MNRLLALALALAARLDRAFVAPCAVFVGSSFARFDGQPGPGLPAHLLVSWGALLAALGVSLLDSERTPGRRAIGSGSLLAALFFGIALAALSGPASPGFGAAAVAIVVLGGSPDASDSMRLRLASVLARGLSFGPLAVLAGFASQCGHGSIAAALVGIPVGVVATLPIPPLVAAAALIGAAAGLRLLAT